jgi:glutathione reductase (NADPH)
LLTGSKVEVYEGAAKIIDPHTVEVQEIGGKSTRYSTKRILVATGSRAVRLDIPGKVLFFQTVK